MRGKINEILTQGESSLLGAFAAGKGVVHVGIDWQRFYCDPDFEASPQRKINSPTIQQALAQMQLTIGVVRCLMPCLWVVHDLPIRDEYLDEDHEAFNLEGRARQTKIDALRRQSQEICVPVASGEPVLTKVEFCAFAHTPLHQYLQACEAEVVLLSGVMRSVCVKQTALTSVFMGYDTYVAEDLTADESLQHLPTYARGVIERAEQGIKMVRFENVKKAFTPLMGSWS